MVKIYTITSDNKVYNFGFKVVTNELKSLGLRRNPNILQYSPGEWYFLSSSQIMEGKNDWGGIWVARTISKAKALKKYMKEKHSKEARIFETLFDEVLYSNDYRIKTNGIYMLEEIL